MDFVIHCVSIFLILDCGEVGSGVADKARGLCRKTKLLKVSLRKLSEKKCKMGRFEN